MFVKEYSARTVDGHVGRRCRGRRQGECIVAGCADNQHAVARRARRAAAVESDGRVDNPVRIVDHQLIVVGVAKDRNRRRRVVRESPHLAVPVGPDFDEVGIGGRDANIEVLRKVAHGNDRGRQRRNPIGGHDDRSEIGNAGVAGRQGEVHRFGRRSRVHPRAAPAGRRRVVHVAGEIGELDDRVVGGHRRFVAEGASLRNAV